MTASILLVCRANLCRSPSAEVLLRRALEGLGVEMAVRSGGLEAIEGRVAPSEFVQAAAARGIGVAEHVSSRLAAGEAAAADLVLTMTRELLRTVVVAEPSAWPRSFTLLELVRRGSADPPTDGEPLAAWLARIHATRDRAELLGADDLDDIADPMGQGDDAYEVLFDRLDDATAELAGLLAAVT